MKKSISDIKPQTLAEYKANKSRKADNGISVDSQGNINYHHVDYEKLIEGENHNVSVDYSKNKALNREIVFNGKPLVSGKNHEAVNAEVKVNNNDLNMIAVINKKGSRQA